MNEKAGLITHSSAFGPQKLTRRHPAV